MKYLADALENNTVSLFICPSVSFSFNTDTRNAHYWRNSLTKQDWRTRYFNFEEKSWIKSRNGCGLNNKKNIAFFDFYFKFNHIFKYNYLKDRYR